MRIEGNKKKGLISKKFWFYLTWDVSFILIKYKNYFYPYGYVFDRNLTAIIAAMFLKIKKTGWETCL